MRACLPGSCSSRVPPPRPTTPLWGPAKSSGPVRGTWCGRFNWPSAFALVGALLVAQIIYLPAGPAVRGLGERGRQRARTAWGLRTGCGVAPRRFRIGDAGRTPRQRARAAPPFIRFRWKGCGARGQRWFGALLHRCDETDHGHGAGLLGRRQERTVVRAGPTRALTA